VVIYHDYAMRLLPDFFSELSKVLETRCVNENNDVSIQRWIDGYLSPGSFQYAFRHQTDALADARFGTSPKLIQRVHERERAAYCVWISVVMAKDEDLLPSLRSLGKKI
jgi:hypothetical protein